MAGEVVRLRGDAEPAWVRIDRDAAIARVRGFIDCCDQAALTADQRGLADEADRHRRDAQALALVLAMAEGRR